MQARKVDAARCTRARGSTQASASDSKPRSAPERPEYRVEALAKGLRLLSFDEQRPTWCKTGLAAAVRLPMPTVYPVVQTLAAEGYLDHLPNGDFRSGVRTLTLGTAAPRSPDEVGGTVRGAGGRVVAGVNVAVHARDWSTERILDELRPALLDVCDEVSILAGSGDLG